MLDDAGGYVSASAWQLYDYQKTSMEAGAKCPFLLISRTDGRVWPPGFPDVMRACLHAIDYLSKFGYSPEQAFLLLGAAPIEGRFSGVVDIPNSCGTVYIPTEIFDFDVRPSASGPVQIDAGMGGAVGSQRIKR